MITGQELERQLAEKEASLPLEPTPDDDNAVTLLVRMPDGSRMGRRFLKSDNLQVWMRLIFGLYLFSCSQPCSICFCSIFLTSLMLAEWSSLVLTDW